MGIDRIGGKGGTPPLTTPEGATGASSAEKAAAPFSLDRGAEARGTSAAGAVGAATPLERLRAGEIDRQTYVELKVDEATRHLAGLRPADLESIRAELRQRLASDPALVDLVRQASGGRYTPPEE